jgi:hypothetical protein
MSDILALIGQYGVMPVIVIVLAIAYDRQSKSREADRQRWEDQLKAERAAADERLKVEREACARERAAFELLRQESYEREREAGEKFLMQLLESQRNMTQVIGQASQMASAFERTEKEIREERTRELRDTGNHRPALGPKGTGR